MTTLLVNLKDEQEERVLLAFLNSLKYNYSTGELQTLSQTQQQEILRRERDFNAGKITSEPWENFKKRFINE